MAVLKTELRREYGNARAYLPNDKIGQAVRALTGKATLSPAHVEALRVLGVQVEASEPCPVKGCAGDFNHPGPHTARRDLAQGLLG